MFATEERRDFEQVMGILACVEVREITFRSAIFDRSAWNLYGAVVNSRRYQDRGSGFRPGAISLHNLCGPPVYCTGKRPSKTNRRDRPGDDDHINQARWPDFFGNSSANSVRFKPSGVSSNAHAIINAIGKPSAVNATKTFIVHGGASNVGNKIDAACSRSQATTP
jgi:hypothetical protein